MNTKKKKLNLAIVIIINLFIFAITNVIFSLKYEQVDDFIIYNLYSGLDGTFNIHGVYINFILCYIIGILYKIIPIVNWHSIFLLIMQFICFTIIGYKILEKQSNKVTIVLYALFASKMYTSLLLLVQYTSVSALLIFTSGFLLFDSIENNEKPKAICGFLLYSIGIMLRIQSILIVIPFFVLYLTKNIILKNNKEKIIKIIKYVLIYIGITFLIYISNFLIYNFNSTYKEYIEYNNIRTMLHDITPIDYNDNKEIFDKIGWSKNDYDIFYTFGFGDEQIYSKEKLNQILDYKIQKDGKKYFNDNLKTIVFKLIEESINNIKIIFVFFIIISIISITKKNKKNIVICITILLINGLFIALNRYVHRVVIPEYICGIALMIYNLEFDKSKNNYSIKDAIILCLIILLGCTYSGDFYKFGYRIEDYEQYQKVIEYTNSQKQNVYLYTVPSLQFRYLAYSVYQMPPEGAFSNLRVIGGWDMFTQNYYDFKNRYNLQGTFLDLLKENVYLVDGDIIWSGVRYDNYKEKISRALKEHYNINVNFKELKEIENVKIYKVEYVKEGG